MILSDVSKTYPRSLTAFYPLLRGAHIDLKSDVVESLKAISLTIKRGEIVGIVGRNGAGKSTLLRLMGKISEPTSGTVQTNGTVATLLDLSAGLQEFRTGRDNIKMRLPMMGGISEVSQDVIEDIVSFSELGSSIDSKVATYSSGMKMRLAFSIATSINADILLVDEALAVGDEFFSMKSFNRLERMAKSGLTSVIVSHDWNKIFRLATRVIWIDKGVIRADGPPGEVLHPFLLDLNAFVIDEKIKMVNIEIRNARGELTRQFQVGDTISLSVTFEKDADVTEFSIISGAMVAGNAENGFSVFSLDQACAFGEGRENTVGVKISYPNIKLHPGEYDLTILTASLQQGAFPSVFHSFWGPQVGSDCRITVIGGSVSEGVQPLVALRPKFSLS